METPSIRQRKIANLLRVEISSCLQRNFAISEGVVLSCQSVKVAKDLKSADVFLSTFDVNNPAEIEFNLLNFKKIKPSKDFHFVVKSWIANNTVLKSIPELHFYSI